MKNDLVKFIHVPKTGGQAVYSAMGMKNRPHDSVRDVMIDPRMYVFSTVRNPYDRAVSLYRWYEQLSDQPKKRRTPHNAAMNVLARGCVGASEFWTKFMTADVLHYSRKYTPMLRPQSWFLKDRYGDISPRIDKLMRFETLGDDWEEVRGRIGESAGDLAVVNGTVRGSWQDELDADAMAVVRELWGVDFDLLGYER